VCRHGSRLDIHGHAKERDRAFDIQEVSARVGGLDELGGTVGGSLRRVGVGACG
jgi:hypothetical protein